MADSRIGESVKKRKPRITVRKSKDPLIEEYFAIVWNGLRWAHMTDYYLERSDARKEAKEWAECHPDLW